MQLNQIRKTFIEYFESKGHKIVKSSSLVPTNDPTLLFTNAGMNQFKNVFLGLEELNYTRATSAQKCVRAGGKHNDLENVGYTARHHTFFEMLGNFSFGDYFKLDAIKFAWEFLTQVLKIPENKLYVTVYHTDDEAYSIWHNQIGLPKNRIIEIADKDSGGSDNFWQMGETGPCGPCTEIFYDHGAEIAGGLPGSENEDGDRYIEIWNCVFMQFNRDEKGVLHPLPKPSVDTGMGLERLTAVMQKVQSNYAIDLFVSLINKASQITNCKDLASPSLKVIADHIRSVSFLIADGIIPSNEGRGYVLRRIIRRAIRHGYKLGLRQSFLALLVDELILQMGDAYPELTTTEALIKKTISQEEEKFFQTIDNGMLLLNKELAALKDKVLPGDIAFKLYDTFGFPLDLTQDVCRERDVKVDINAFEQSMNNQRALGKSAGKFKMGSTLEYDGPDTMFTGYTEEKLNAKVIAIYKDNQAVNNLKCGEEGIIVLDKTVFYAESGGQVGDRGVLHKSNELDNLFIIEDCQKIRPQVIGHLGKVSSGLISLGDTVTATFDIDKRIASARNHSATHLLHKALHEVIGSHALQKGSLVSSEYARLDFVNPKPLTDDEILAIEQRVNHIIMLNYPVELAIMSYEEAIKSGATALFGEKYTDSVRVIKMGEYSTELCGGTHIKRTGDIGLFTIVSETGIANGIRRIEAITGDASILRMQKNVAILNNIKEEFKTQTYDNIQTKLNVLASDNKLLIKQVSELKSKMALLQADTYIDKAILLSNKVKLIILEVADMDKKTLNDLALILREKLISGIVVIAAKNNERINLIVGVTKDLNNQHKAGLIVSKLANYIGGKGGGRPDLAEGSGAEVDKLCYALEQIKEYISSN